MNQEMGLKLVDALYEYHETFIDPRLRRLELPFWRRWFTPKPEPYKKAPTADEMFEKYEELQEAADDDEVSG